MFVVLQPAHPAMFFFGQADDFIANRKAAIKQRSSDHRAKPGKAENPVSGKPWAPKVALWWYVGQNPFEGNLQFG